MNLVHQLSGPAPRSMDGAAEALRVARRGPKGAAIITALFLLPFVGMTFSDDAPLIERALSALMVGEAAEQ